MVEYNWLSFKQRTEEYAFWLLAHIFTSEFFRILAPMVTNHSIVDYSISYQTKRRKKMEINNLSAPSPLLPSVAGFHFAEGANSTRSHRHCFHRVQFVSVEHYFCHCECILCGDANKSTMHLDAGNRSIDESTISTHFRCLRCAVRRL